MVLQLTADSVSDPSPQLHKVHKHQQGTRDKGHFVGAIRKWKIILHKLRMEIRKGKKSDILEESSNESNISTFQTDEVYCREDMIALPKGFSYRSRK